MRIFSRILTLCLPMLVSLGAISHSSAQTKSFELGTNLDSVTDYSSQLPFLDLFRMSREWYTQNVSTFDTGEAGLLNLDIDGWLRSLSPIGTSQVSYTRVCSLLLTMGAVEGGPENGKLPYPSGAYTVQYEGQGTLEYGLAASKNFGASSPGRDIINVTPQEPGIQICITATDPNNTGNYLRNIRVYAPGNESLAQSALFDPSFLNRLAPFTTLRFMDWMHTNNSSQKEVEDMARVSSATWTTRSGVPAEIMAWLSNVLNAKPWFNMPHQATDAYVAEFATIIRNTLQADLDIYVEYSNEIWNDQFTQGGFISHEGNSKFSPSNGSEFDRRLNRFGERTAQICTIWREVFAASADRIQCVMGGQAANTYIAEQALECPFSTLAPCRSHGITAIAIAPYVGDGIGLSNFESTVEGWTLESDGGLANLFEELNNESVLIGAESGMPTVTSRIAFHKELAKQQGIELLAYEGGQHLVGVGGPANNKRLNDLFDAASRDPRMGTLYKNYFNTWIKEGGALFMHFSDIGNYSRFGRWGALEIATQQNSPKHDALIQISRTECLLNWAELQFPDLLSPSVEFNQLQGDWVYRQYAGTGNLIGTSAADNSVYVLGPFTSGSVLKVGSIVDFLQTAGCR